MNPFKRLNLYTPDVMREYSGQSRGELEPHLFAIAEESYRRMIKDNRNQSIIVSGESGAGKTMSAKYIMRYFATVDDLDNKESGGVSEIEDAVLSTNPIMESFGNSKTTRNDNSSRFGKYIEILFTRSQTKQGQVGVKICGAKIRTYLLERSRLIFQPISERNYHIFYQMCSGMPSAERKEFGLGSWETFHFLNQGQVGTIPNVDDAAEFVLTQKGLSVIGVSVAMQWDIFKLCAGLLHMGNIKISSIRDEASIADDDIALIKSCELLGMNKNEFKKWLIKRQISTGREKLVKNQNASTATVARDSVAKFIYSQLFDWLVKIINRNLAKDEAKSNNFIGVLDIYGFEHFKKNSFEQFCINYANEKLQQEFNAHVFKLEQDEYKAEKLVWVQIDFDDNQACIDLIEGKLGILDLLDEESRLPSGTDTSLINKYYQRFNIPTQKFFIKPKFGQTAFTIKHYAHDVTYEIESFLEKNKDTVSEEQLGVMNSSDFTFLKDVIHIEEPATPVEDLSGPRRGGAPKKPTLGSIFKASLVKLMETIRSTEPHYIRCIKPNQTKKPFDFEAQMVLAQLRACGVLETIKISCAGYPNRWTYSDFANRFFLLVPSKEWSADPKKLTETIVMNAISAQDKYQMGTTKIFFRSGQLAILDGLRQARYRTIVILLQKNARRHIYQSRYEKMREATIALQSDVRGWLARRKYREIREKIAATKIQRTVRGWLQYRKYADLQKAALSVQKLHRMHVAEKLLEHLRRVRSSVAIQRIWRGFVCKRDLKLAFGRILMIQSSARRHKATKEYNILKAESKSIGKLQEVNVKLESKVVELSQIIAQRNVENKALLEKIAQLEGQSESWKEKFTSENSKSKNSNVQNTEMTSEMKKELRELKESKDTVTKDYERMVSIVKKKDDEISNLEQEVTRQKEEVRRLKEDMKEKPKPTQEDPVIVTTLRKEITSLRDQMSKIIAGKWRAERIADNSMVNQQNDSSYSTYTSPNSASPPSNRVISPRNGLYPEPRDYTYHDYNPYVKPTEEFDGVEAEKSLTMLEDKLLEEEIIESLITNLRIPLPSTQTVATKKEIFFPAHLIGTIMIQLIQNDLSLHMQHLMGNVMKAIQSLTMKFEDDYVSAFWLSNCYELLCVVRTAQDKEAREQTRRRIQQGRRGEEESSEAERALDKLRGDLDYLLIEIYHGWVKELKKRLSHMIVPAVIENQSLPGYICKQSGGLWGKWGKSSAGTQFTIEQLLNFLSKLSKTMRCYYMEDSMTRQLLTELLRVIGVSAFNHLLMRRNFCTWKRGVQIQYNVSRLEEWCTSHGIAEATLHLQQLLQAAKLLTLNKTSPQDIETIFDVCFLLNPTQIKKLLSLYYAADFDSPLSPELLKIVASRAVLNEKSDVLLLDLEQAPDFVKPNARTVDQVEKFVPAWMSLPNIAQAVAGTA
ncbi:Myosin type-2 heavy chain 1 [Nowakowskiella sp. JEL0078]|nr:Myosin type-2 heavy chain 1 [Nowakowskiella sp. JEL0078]